MITFKEQDLQLLPKQGHCNLNYLLEQNGKKYLVRKFKLADRDRNLEYKIQKLAFQKGIAAKPLYMDDSIMIGEFVEGIHKKKLSKKELRQLALVIKKLHKIKLRQRPVNFPKKIMRKVRKFKKELVLCHGDLSVNNILFENTTMLIDWEYAGVNDKYFDLASICMEFKLTKLEETFFLRAYGGKIDFEKLEGYKEIFDILSKEWFEQLEKGKLEFLS